LYPFQTDRPLNRVKRNLLEIEIVPELHRLVLWLHYFFQEGGITPLIKESSLSLLLVNEPSAVNLYLIIEVLDEVR
jgi:hypothetical protein